MAQDKPVDTNRIQRVLAYMIAAIVIVSIVAIFVNLAATGADVNKGEGFWPVIVLLPAVGLPIGMILVVALLVTTVVSRGRAARDGKR